MSWCCWFYLRYLSNWSWMYFPKRLLLLFRSVQALPAWKEKCWLKTVFSGHFKIHNPPEISCLTESFHNRVGVQHPPLYPLYCVLTPRHWGGGRHSGVVLHQATRRPRLPKKIIINYPALNEEASFCQCTMIKCCMKNKQEPDMIVLINKQIGWWLGK